MEASAPTGVAGGCGRTHDPRSSPQEATSSGTTVRALVPGRDAWLDRSKTPSSENAHTDRSASIWTLDVWSSWIWGIPAVDSRSLALSRGKRQVYLQTVTSRCHRTGSRSRVRWRRTGCTGSQPPFQRSRHSRRSASPGRPALRHTSTKVAAGSCSVTDHVGVTTPPEDQTLREGK